MLLNWYSHDSFYLAEGRHSTTPSLKVQWTIQGPGLQNVVNSTESWECPSAWIVSETKTSSFLGGGPETNPSLCQERSH